MSKKIIAVAILMVAIVVVFAACKKDDYKVSHTIPVGDGEVVEVYEDEDGSEFVTNMDGDKIPVTTDKDGFYDDIAGLVTQTTTTTTKADKDNKTTTTTKADKDNTTTKADKDNTTTTTTEADKDNTTTTTTEADKDNTTTTTNKIVIGGSSGKQDSISWEEIKNAGKN